MMQPQMSHSINSYYSDILYWLYQPLDTGGQDIDLSTERMAKKKGKGHILKAPKVSHEELINKEKDTSLKFLNRERGLTF